MRVGGWITKPTVLVDLFMLMAMFTMDNGLTIRLMDMVFTAILMELVMKANGKRISSTELVLRLGLMVPSSMANMSRAKSTVKVPLPGLMDQLILVNSLRIIFKVTESTTGPMVENSMVHG